MISAGPLAFIGKLPAQGDFLRVGGSSDPLLAFDEWMHGSMEWAAAHAGADFPRAFSDGLIHAFVFRPPGLPRNVLSGALAPSTDTAGRRFPFAAAAPFGFGPELQHAPHLLPLMLEPFWQAASELVAQARVLDVRELGTVCEQQVDIELSMPHAASIYEEWTDELALSELLGFLGYSEPGSSLRVFELFVEALRPLRRVECPTSPLTLRLPLGAAGGAALCFWLDLTRRLLSWRETVPSFFWSHDGRAGSLLLHLGVPPKSALAELWLPTGARDEYCDLVSAPPPMTVALPELEPGLRRVVESGDAYVADLLEAADHSA